MRSIAMPKGKALRDGRGLRGSAFTGIQYLQADRLPRRKDWYRRVRKVMVACRMPPFEAWRAEQRDGADRFDWRYFTRMQIPLTQRTHGGGHECSHS